VAATPVATAPANALGAYGPEAFGRPERRVLAILLTDYHVHLRTDDPDTPPERFFTPGNAERYRETAEERGIRELGVAEHIHRFTQALQVWDHAWYRRWARDDVDAYAGFVREETDLKLGIEVDFLPGREDHLANFLERAEWDFVVGSVHFIGDLAMDIGEEDYDVWRHIPSAERVWKRYFETLAEASRSGLYDIMAHPDLVKVWGRSRPLPEGDLRRYYEPAIEAMAEGGVAMEVSTAGLRKPVGELYPAPAMIELAVEAGVPIALSSDAHVPDHLGFAYDRALEVLEACGVREIAVFDRRERRLEPVG
jgi:histidinol-phosphatase (PHP family)